MNVLRESAQLVIRGKTERKNTRTN